MGLALAAMVIPAAYAQLQPTPKRMVAMSVPAHVDAVHGTANVKLHLDAGALPTTFKVTTKGAGMSNSEIQCLWLLFGSLRCHGHIPGLICKAARLRFSSGPKIWSTDQSRRWRSILIMWKVRRVEDRGRIVRN